MKTTNLKGLAYSRAAVSLGEHTPGKRLTQRTTQKPLNRFADAPALVAIREQAKPDKNTATKADTSNKPKDEMGPQSNGKRTSRSTPDGSQLLVGISSSDQPATAPAKVKVDTAMVSSDPSWSSKRRGGRSGDALDVGVVSGGRAQMRQTAHILPVNAPRAAGGEPTNAAVRATGGIGTAPLSNTEAKAPKAVPADVFPQARQGSQVNRGANTTRIVQTELRTKGQGGQATTRPQSSDGSRWRRVAGNVVTKGDGANPTVPPSVVSATRPALTVKKPDQVSTAMRSASRSPVVETPRGSERNAQGVHSEDQPQATSKCESAPGSQNSQMAVPSGGKEIPSGNHTEGTNGQAQGPAYPAIQPHTVVPPVPSETQAHAMDDSAAVGSPVRNVGEQILDSVQASLPQGGTQIVVRLQPPELGIVVVRFREQGSHLEGIVQAGQSETRQEIERALPEVIRGLQDAGIPIRKFDVTAGDVPEQGLDRGLSEQDAWSGQQGSGQNRDRLSGTPTPWSGTVADSAVDSPEGPDTARQLDASEGGIDMLL